MDLTHWILIGVAVVFFIGLTVLRLGMRGSGRGGAYMAIRIIISLVVILGFAAWRWWQASHAAHP